MFSAGSRPALKTMGLPDRGWSVGSTKSEQLNDVKSVITVTFAMCQTVKSVYANLIFGGKFYNSRPTSPHQENVYVDIHTQPLADVENNMKRRRTGAGIIDVTGSGLESVSCFGRSFTKSGQNLSVDVGDCADEVQISSLQHCSDQDEIGPTMGKSFVRLDVPLVRSWCSSVGVTTCTGSGDHPSAAHFGHTGSKVGETVNL